MLDVILLIGPLRCCFTFVTGILLALGFVTTSCHLSPERQNSIVVAFLSENSFLRVLSSCLRFLKHALSILQLKQNL
jgi:hypothetical protein